MAVSANQDQVLALEALKQEAKFVETQHYPGAPTEDIRSRCEARVNEFLVYVTGQLREGIDEAALYSSARSLVDSFDREDTEEREKVGDYIGDAMSILDLHDWIEHV